MDHVKKYLPFLISLNQTAYVDGRFISKGGRSFSDILQVTDFLNLRGLLVTVDIQKTFDSVNNCIKQKLALGKHLLSGYKFY